MLLVVKMKDVRLFDVVSICAAWRLSAPFAHKKRPTGVGRDGARCLAALGTFGGIGYALSGFLDIAAKSLGGVASREQSSKGEEGSNKG